MVSDPENMRSVHGWVEQRTLAQVNPKDPSVFDLMGAHEVEIPFGAPCLGVDCVEGRVFASIGMMDGDDSGETETLSVTIRGVTERFFSRDAGSYIGAIHFGPHTLYAFDTSESVLEEIRERLDASLALANEIRRTRLLRGGE